MSQSKYMLELATEYKADAISMEELIRRVGDKKASEIKLLSDTLLSNNVISRIFNTKTANEIFMKHMGDPNVDNFVDDVYDFLGDINEGINKEIV